MKKVSVFLCSAAMLMSGVCAHAQDAKLTDRLDAAAVRGLFRRRPFRVATGLPVGLGEPRERVSRHSHNS